MKIFKQLLTCVSPRLNILWTFKRYHGYYPNLKHPKSLDEKIQWLKLHVHPYDPIYAGCADKFAVREYIKEKGLAELLPPLIGVYNDAEEIEFDKLPTKFALKYNFGFGMNIICKDKSKLDISKAIKKLKRWNKRKAHLTHAEMHYKYIPHRILVEEYIDPDEGQKSPIDYKIYCFNGKPYCCMLCSDRGTGDTKFRYIDRDFNRLHIEYGDEGVLPTNLDREKISQMFEYADILSQDFPLVRVDFYLSRGKIYFGELTFSPAGGHDRTRIPEADKQLGEMLTLPPSLIGRK
ncbi:ATP-grasp fold amidoligase family protein [Porphyromonas sp.]|uniref:ATP-grasp fold amidoligase family protein n=1 Tax=Porphyromonas sp. TaxID=1924944 RepID=UPI0026DD72F0|nr:ATP-grasp fold amidoligase family protein [Porphyromonas sp.]MDO4695362.1 ATP-grasp fold amidoligase family protein [Porphyromonas sp.]MDO4770363.1 ATP-grasp fold amidoligase family protein [Porphyromonas sp.]